MRTRVWFLYVLVGVSATLTFLLVPGMRIGAILNLVGLSSPVAILIAIRLNKIEHKLPWLLIALGQVFFVAGDVITYNYERFFGTTLPFPSIGDVFYLLVYPFLLGGILLLIRRRNPGRDRDSAIDTLIVGIGVGVLSWVFLIAPYTHDSTLTTAQKLVSMGYPLMDLMLITGAIRLVVGRGRRNQAFYLLLAAVVALFLTDAIYGWFGLHGGYNNQTGYLEGGWAAFYLLFGAAALHPAVRQFSERSSEVRARLSRVRLAILAVVSLTAPITDAVLVSRYATGNQRVDELVVITASVILFLLVIARMSGLVRQQEQSAARERALREAGAALVTATNRAAIHDAAIKAAQALAGEDAAVRICEAVDDETDTLVTVAALGGTEEVTGRRISLSVLQDWKIQRLREREAYLVRSSDSSLLEPLSLLQDEDGSVHVAPLFIRDEFRGMVVVATPEEMPLSVADSLRALSSQVALALESAALTEDLLIQQSEARFASLVKNSSDVVTVIEPDSVVRYASPSSSRVLGVEPAQLEGTRFVDLIHPDDKTHVLQFLSSIGDGEGNTGCRRSEFRMQHQDGGRATSRRSARTCCTTPTSEGHRAQHPRHHRAQGVRGAARAPGVPRLRHRTSRTARSSATASSHAIERQERDHQPSRRAVHGPRRLQDDQRLAGARGRRPGPGRGRRAPRGQACAPPTPRRASAGTSSRSCWRTAATACRPRRSRTASCRCSKSHSPWRARRSSSGRASGSPSPTGRAAPARRPPRSCSATQTSRCTWRRRSGKGRYQVFEPDDARHRPAPPRAEGRPPACARARGVHPALPAGDRARDRAASPASRR